MGTIVSGFTDSTPLLADPEALRARSEADGFLYFHGLVPRELVLELRGAFLGILKRFGWVTDAGDCLDGRVNAAAIEREDPAEMTAQGVGIHNAAYAEVQKTELFHRIAHHPNILGALRAVFGGEVFVHPRHIARLILPAPFNKPTPSHQDFIHIQGTRNVWTCWMPVGDCPREMGNLTILRGSHRRGLLGVGAAEGAGGLEAHLCGDDFDWVEGDFTAGDALMFPSLTVHRALKPTVTDRVRLSCDFRYQPAGEEIEERSLKPHGEIIPWDEIYAGWKATDLQYYWRDANLPRAEWDDSIRWQKEKIC